MAIGISNGTSQSALQNATKTVEQSANRISSGKKINSAADDAAGLAISEALSSQISGQRQSIRNVGDGISMAQTKMGAINTMVEGVQRIRELSVQSANGIYSDQDRELLNREIESITSQLNETLEGSRFNGRSLFAGEDQQIFQVGPDSGDTISVSSKDLKTTLDNLGLGDLSLSSQEEAANGISIADSALNVLSQAASEVGAVQNRFESTIDSLRQEEISSTATRSSIRDADIAKEASALRQNEIREQVAIAVQSQANARASDVLALLS